MGMRPDIRRSLRAGIEIFSRLSYRYSVVLCVSLVALASYLDFRTGIDASPVLLYLVPIALGSWFLRVGDGYRLAALSGVVFLATDLLTRAHYLKPLIHVWNGVSVFGLFVVAAYTLSELRSHVDSQKKLARVDFLTAIANRRGFQESMEAEILRARRWNTPLTIAYMDIDYFKALNDKMGHAKGDLLLKQTATLLRDNLRATDALARMGGDEFAFILVGSAPAVVKKVVEKIHYGLRGMAMANDWPVSFSIGVVTYLSPPRKLDDMLRAADELMYEVKQDRGAGAQYRVVEAEPDRSSLAPVAGGTTIS